MKPLLDAADVALLLNISRRKLEGLVARGKGPPFMRFGRIRRWRSEDIDAWVTEQLETSIKRSPVTPGLTVPGAESA